MIRENGQMLFWIGLLALTTWWLKKNWWDHLSDADQQWEKTANPDAPAALAVKERMVR
jgi:hypothetical protein